MKKSTAQNLLNKVQNSYNSIAQEFSDTRNYAWEEFKYFKPLLFEGAEIVDLGCGNGRLLNYLYQHYLSGNFKYIGLDNSIGLLKQAEKKFPGQVFLPGDLLNIPLESNQVDIMFSIASFHHLPSFQLRLQALLEIKRTLKPGGYFILTVWNLWQKKYWKENLQAWLRSLTTFGDYAPNDLFISWKNGQKSVKTLRYYHNFLPQELNHLIKKAGFTIEDSFSAKKGSKVSFLNGFNYCLICKND